SRSLGAGGRAGSRGDSHGKRIVLAARAGSPGWRFTADFGSGVAFETHPMPGVNPKCESLALRTAEAVPHGWRATFCTWVDDTRPADSDAAEKALAHEDRNRVAGAYRRSDLL